MITPGTKFPLVIMYAVALHAVWGMCALIDVSAYNGTALSGVHALFGELTPYVCLSVASLAIAALYIRSMLYGFILMMPQQCLLFISAFAALHAVVDAQFADGVIRSREFILADQAPAIIGATAHTLAMIKIALSK